MNNKICAVIVTYNRCELLKQAIESLKNQTLSCDILVVNNGSTDGTYEFLQHQKDIRVIHQENVGGAGGFFTGMKSVCENGYEFCWVMDDDIIASPDALLALYDSYKMLSDEKIGFLCSNVMDTDGNPANTPSINERRSHNGYINWSRLLEKGIVEVSSATFVSVFIPCNVIREVGLPYREFFIWGDDTEYTNRISMTHKCYLVGNSYITHLRPGGAINLVNLTDKNRIKMYQYSIRNNWFNNKQGYYDQKTVLINYLWYFAIIFRLFKSGQFKKIGIVFKGIVKGINFKPIKEFPDNYKSTDLS